MTNEKYPLIDPLMENETRETPGSPEVERIERQRELRGHLSDSDFFSTMIRLYRIGGNVKPLVKRWIERKK